jgi:hypothetical protein
MQPWDQPLTDQDRADETPVPVTHRAAYGLFVGAMATLFLITAMGPRASETIGVDAWQLGMLAALVIVSVSVLLMMRAGRRPT